MSALPPDQLVNAPIATAPDPATALCVACGLCCDGTLHNHALLSPEDVDQARRLGLEVIDDASVRLSFRLPCPRFCGRCTVFPDRPRICGTYRCKLLKELDADQVDLTTALDRVAMAKSLVADTLAADASGAPTLETRQRAVRSVRDDNSESMDNNLKLRALALQIHLERFFLKDKARSLEFE